jgi:hypothetical protein
MKATIDRIEGEKAVLLMGEEGRVKVDMPLVILPNGCKEGDILDITIIKDEETTRETKERVSALMEKLKKKGQSEKGIVKGPGA